VLLGLAPADLGSRGRRFVQRHHRWDTQLQAMDRLIADVVKPLSGQAAA
jgi:hypothetical protein